MKDSGKTGVLKRRAILGGVCLMLFGGGIFRVRQLTEPDLPLSKLPLYPELQKAIVEELKHGDILFRGRDNSWGELGALASRKDQRYGHVGVVVRQDAAWNVISATGNPLADSGAVVSEPLEKFIGTSTRLGLYRLSLDADLLAAFLTAIETHAARKTPFDRLYDISENEAVYCTELIWLCLNSTLGRDVIPDKAQWRGRSVIALDDLQRASVMKQVLHLDRENLRPIG